MVYIVTHYTGCPSALNEIPPLPGSCPHEPVHLIQNTPTIAQTNPNSPRSRITLHTCPHTTSATAQTFF